MMKQISMPVIAYMHSPYREKFGIPRQPNLVDVQSYVELCPPYNDLQAFAGIEQFSHLWLLWQFHDNKSVTATDTFRAQVRPPRLGGNQKIGVFASRSMYRPAAIGLSVVRFEKIVKQGSALRVYVRGSDLLDGTPILDIKPYIQYSDAILDAQSGYAQQQPMVKKVCWQMPAQQQCQQLLAAQCIDPQHIQELQQVLALDPRPAYQQDAQRVYGLSFANFNVKFTVSTDQVQIEHLSLLD
ncbi:tRNA (N6-threonylcarbamoyladenosine(37)-N6)-methyltransferase TrmO [Acinetobacter larvae]|uniref:tRNA (N6-threonylcarbamoyladenosine(37)-N6)-methyltransferase TrmO n=2 Tax=Acinetobacter larvae TaxID=1789224 RepID=A0A1B2M4B3_9GAMM|nr:tRNA (N6-threonylcarbamoyladenosine(37)-N6)-methyltransferase TrmO [Acinetobacter larvae]